MGGFLPSVYYPIQSIYALYSRIHLILSYPLCTATCHLFSMIPALHNRHDAMDSPSGDVRVWTVQHILKFSHDPSFLIVLGSLGTKFSSFNTPKMVNIPK